MRELLGAYWWGEGGGANVFWGERCDLGGGWFFLGFDLGACQGVGQPMSGSMRVRAVEAITRRKSWRGLVLSQ